MVFKRTKKGTSGAHTGKLKGRKKIGKRHF